LGGENRLIAGDNAYEQVLFEGAIVMAVVSGNPGVVQQAEAMARRCMDAKVSGKKN